MVGPITSPQASDFALSRIAAAHPFVENGTQRLGPLAPSRRYVDSSFVYHY